MKKSHKVLLTFLVTIANFWIWKIFHHSILLGLVLVILTFATVFKKKLLSFVLLFVLSMYLLASNFDTNLLYISPLDQDKLWSRHEFYAQNLGRIYMNRVGLIANFKVFPYVSKLTYNFGYALDPNIYFFAGHPRERLGIEESAKFPSILMIFFLIGVVHTLSRPSKFLVSYFLASVLVSTLIYPGFSLGSVLLFPFIVTVIVSGLLRLKGVTYED